MTLKFMNLRHLLAATLLFLAAPLQPSAATDPAPTNPDPGGASLISHFSVSQVGSGTEVYDPASDLSERDTILMRPDNTGSIRLKVELSHGYSTGVNLVIVDGDGAIITNTPSIATGSTLYPTIDRTITRSPYLVRVEDPSHVPLLTKTIITGTGTSGTIGNPGITISSGGGAFSPGFVGGSSSDLIYPGAWVYETRGDSGEGDAGESQQSCGSCSSCSNDGKPSGAGITSGVPDPGTGMETTLNRSRHSRWPSAPLHEGERTGEKSSTMTVQTTGTPGMGMATVTLPAGSSDNGRLTNQIVFTAPLGSAFALSKANFHLEGNGGFTRTATTTSVTILTQSACTVITEVASTPPSVVVTFAKDATSTPVRTTTFTKSGANGYTMTTVYESKSISTVWDFSAGSPGAPTLPTWFLSEANGLRKTTKVVSTVPGVSKTVHQVLTEKNSAGTDVTVSDEVITYISVFGGYKKYKSEVYPATGLPLTTIWTYYWNNTDSPESRGQVKSESYPDGTIRNHTYLAGTMSGLTGVTHTITSSQTLGPITLVETRFRDAASGSVYSTTTLNGATISKWDDIWTSSSGLHTKTHHDYRNATDVFTTTTDYYATGITNGGIEKKVVFPDGTMRTTGIVTGSTDKIITICEGAGSGGVVVCGTQTILDVDQNAQLYHRLVTAINTGGAADGMVLEESQATAWDTGLVTAVDYFPSGGSPLWTISGTFNCCGLASLTDKFGITTYYAYDDANRVIRENVNGVTIATEYDGLSIKTYRYAEGAGPPSTASTSMTSATIISDESRDQADLVHISKGVSPQDGSFVELSRTTTNYQNPIVNPGSVSVGKVVVVQKIHTADDGGTTQPTQQWEYRFGNWLVHTVGDLASEQTFTYSTGSATVGGSAYSGLKTISYLGPYTSPTSHHESSTTIADWSGRKVINSSEATGDTAYSYYSAGASAGNAGHIASITDADAVTTSYSYNSRGALLLVKKGAGITGTDEVFSSEEIYALRGTVGVIRKINIAWKPGGTAIVLSQTDQKPTGLESWADTLPGATGVASTAHSYITLPASGSPGTWSETSVAANGQTRRSYCVGGLLKTKALWLTEGAASSAAPSFISPPSGLVAGTTYTYDSTIPTRITVDTDLRKNDGTYGLTHSYTYLAANCDALTSVAEPPGAGATVSRITTYTYDHRGRKKTISLPDSSVQSFIYFMDGQLQSSSGSQMYATAYTYDYAHRMQTLTTYGTSTATTTWTYSATTGLLTSKTDAAGKSVNYGYTSGGRLQSRVWARGATTTYAYDSTGRLWKQNYWTTSGATTHDGSTPNLEYIYDSLGRVDHVNRDGNTHYNYAYDSDKLTAATERQVDVPATFLTYFPRLLTRKTDSLLRPAGYYFGSPSDPDAISEVSYDYSNGARLSKITYQATPGATTLPAPSIFTYGYDYSRSGDYDSAGSGRTSLMPFGIDVGTSTSGPTFYHQERTYESRRDVLHSVSNLGGGSTISSYTYGVNNLGQRISLTQAGTGTDTVTWGYDAAGEVQSAASASHASTDSRYFAYDGIGNRNQSRAGGSTATTGTATNYYPASTGSTTGGSVINQYGKIDNGTAKYPLYDDDGNLTYENATVSGGTVTPAAGSWIYTWDGENRLIQAEQSGTTVNYVKVVYAYDYLGRMYLRTTYTRQSGGAYNAGETFCYTYDGRNRIDSQVDWSWLRDEYVWGLDVSGTRRGTGGVGGLLMWHGTTDAYTTGTNNYTYYPAYDGNGNVTELVSPSGTVGAHWEYDPFGNILRTTSIPAAGMNPGTYFEFKFSTKPQDRNTGMYYYGYRFYDPATGKWPSKDPLGQMGGMNEYGFVNNTPNQMIDCFGLFQTLTGKQVGNCYEITMKAVLELPSDDDLHEDPNSLFGKKLTKSDGRLEEIAE
jgi:RHS repeat-associated protein